MENILVTVRFKPISHSRRDEKDKLDPKPKLNDCWKVLLDPHNVVSNQRTKQSFTYDYVFSDDSENFQIFEILALPLIQCALEGINSTIFAYGQTSSGKTYTIQGTPTSPGLISLGLDYIFSYILSNPRTYRLRISYLEVYNEQVNDLLDTTKTNLEIRERLDKSIFVEKLSEIEVESKEKAFELLALGDSNRKIGETHMNLLSSRSHTVFRVIIESEDNVSRLLSQMNFVDLAGSEGVQKSKCEDMRLREGCNINKSLLSLSSVIQKLSEARGTKNFINFRDSKMTRLLQPALSGNSKTAVICTVNPDIAYYQETMNTLLFGSKAKKIKTDIRLNEIMINEEQIRNMGEENKRMFERVQDMENCLGREKENYHKLLEEVHFKEADFMRNIKIITSEKARMLEENSNLSRDIIEKDKEIYQYRENMFMLENKINEMNCDSGIHIERFRISNERIASLEQELNIKNAEISVFEKEIIAQQQRAQSLDQRLREVIETNLQLQNEIKGSIEIINSKTEEINVCTRDLLIEHNKCKSLEQELGGVVEKNIKLENEIKEYIEIINVKNEEIRTYEKNYLIQHEKYGSLEQELREKIEKNIQLQNQIKECIGEINVKAEEINVYEKNSLIEYEKYKGLERVLIEVNEKNQQLQNEIRDFIETINAKASEINGYKTDSLIQSQKYKSLELEFQEAIEKNIKLQKEANTVNIIINTKHEEIEYLKAIIVKDKEMLEQASLELTAYKQMVNDFQENQMTNHGRYSQLTKELEESKITNGHLLEQISLLKQETNEGLISLTSTLDNKKGIIKNYENLFDELTINHNKLQDANSKLSSKLNEITNTHKASLIEIASLEICSQKQAEELKVIKDSYNSKSEECNKLTVEIKKLLSEKMDIEKKCSELQEDLDDQINQKLYLDQEVIDLKYEIQQKFSHSIIRGNQKDTQDQILILEAMTVEKDKLLQESDAIYEKYKEVSSSNDILNKKNQELQQRNDELEKRVSSSNEIIEKYEQECKSLQRKHDYKRLSSALVDESMLESLSASEKYQLKVSLAESQHENQSLKEDLKNLTQSNQDLKLEIVKLTNLNEKSLADNEGTGKKIIDLENNLVQLQNEIGYLRAERDTGLYGCNNEDIENKYKVNQKTLDKGRFKNIHRVFDPSKSPNCKTQ